MTLVKEVILVRHGESLANRTHGSARQLDLGLKDAKLTNEGRRQAEALQKHNDLTNVEVVICSPLSRALQTACIAFAHQDVPIICVADATEFPRKPWMRGHENVGRHVNELKEDTELKQLAKFDKIDWSLVENHQQQYGGDWWVNEYRSEVIRAQVSRLKQYLMEREESRIVVVGHKNLFTTLVTYGLSVPQGGVVRSNLYVNGQGLVRCRPTALPVARLQLKLIASVRKARRWLQKVTGFHTNAVHPERNVNPFVIDSDD